MRESPPRSDDELLSVNHQEDTKKMSYSIHNPPARKRSTFGADVFPRMENYVRDEAAEEGKPGKVDSLLQRTSTMLDIDVYFR